MMADDPLLRYTDPIRALAEDILREKRREDVAAPWFTAEIVRRYSRMVAAPLDANLRRYATDGGVSGLARRLLKRNCLIAGLRVPERIRINRLYRPTLICTVADLRLNAQAKRRAIAYDKAAVKPIEQLADLVEAAGRKTVGEAFPEK